MRWARRLQCAAACVLVAAYAGFSHYCNTVVGAHDWGAALALSPLTVFLLFVIWRDTPRLAALFLTAALGGLLYGLWPLLKHHYSLLYLLQESSVYLLLGVTFGRSLLRGHVALCTQMADKVHGPLSPREVRYTRRVTAAWTLFFFLVTTASLVLFVAAPLRIWSAYINFCVAPLVGAMFVGENLVRRVVLPQVKQAGLLATVRVYFASPQ